MGHNKDRGLSPPSHTAIPQPIWCWYTNTATSYGKRVSWLYRIGTDAYLKHLELNGYIIEPVKEVLEMPWRNYRICFRGGPKLLEKVNELAEKIGWTPWEVWRLALTWYWKVQKGVENAETDTD